MLIDHEYVYSRKSRAISSLRGPSSAAVSAKRPVSNKVAT
jgi:hypothetical protein